MQNQQSPQDDEIDLRDYLTKERLNELDMEIKKC